MDLNFSKKDETFRRTVADWMKSNLSGRFAQLKGRGGPGDEHSLHDLRHEWEKRMAESRWTCVGWPKEDGGRGLSIEQQVIFFEEYARAGGPGRVGHIGEGLVGPTISTFGNDEQKKRFLPPIVAGEELWCQGYSEPNAGSDLANVRTKARLENGEWVIDGQKTWTSLAMHADWCFVLCRTEEDSKLHRGLSYILVPMRQSGITVRPIMQMTGTSEFNEVYFDGARTAEDNIVGRPGEGWSVAMGTLAFERGVSTLGQQMQFRNELDAINDIARQNGRDRDPMIQRRLVDAWIGLKAMRANALIMLSRPAAAELPREAYIYKISWSIWHRDLGKLAMDVLGPDAEIGEDVPYDLSSLQRLFLFVRADTIYAGTNQIQRNIIAERALGMPKEPRR